MPTHSFLNTEEVDIRDHRVCDFCLCETSRDNETVQAKSRMARLEGPEAPELAFTVPGLEGSY